MSAVLLILKDELELLKPAEEGLIRSVSCAFEPNDGDEVAEFPSSVWLEFGIVIA